MNNGIKVLYVDIDGVLIPYPTKGHIKRFQRGKQEGQRLEKYDYNTLRPDKVKHLKRIIEETGAVIVISSSWRHNMQRVVDAFKQAGLPLTFIIDRTPSYLGHGRGHEILTHLHYWNRTCKAGQHISDYVAIDDDEFDMKQLNRLGKFFKTRATTGLTNNIAIKIIDYLNRDEKTNKHS